MSTRLLADRYSPSWEGAAWRTARGRERQPAPSSSRRRRQRWAVARGALRMRRARGWGGRGAAGRGEERVRGEAGEGRDGGEAEEVEEEETLRVVAAQVVEGAALVGVDDGGARLVDELVAPGQGPRPPAQVLPEAGA